MRDKDKSIFQRLMFALIINLAFGALIGCVGTKSPPVKQPLWQLSFPEPYIYGDERDMVTSDGILFCLTHASYPEHEGTLYAIEGKSGIILWKRSMQMDAIASHYNKHRLIAASDGFVYYKSKSGELCALDAHTGDERWCYSNFSRLLSIWNSEAHIFDNNKKYIVLDAKTGTIQATNGITDDSWTRLVIADGRRYLFNNKHLTVTDIQTGIQLWSYKPEDYVNLKMSAVAGLLYLSDESNSIIAFEGSNGRVLWQRYHLGTPLIIDSHIAYAGSRTNEGYIVVLLDPMTGAEIGTVMASSGIGGEPIVNEGILYSFTFIWDSSRDAQAKYNQSSSGTYSLVAKNTTNRNTLWTTKPISGEYVTRPLIADGFVYLGVGNVDWNNSASLFAYGLTSSSPQ